MKIGAGFDLNSIPREILHELDVLSIENPLYPGYLDSPGKDDPEKVLKLGFKGEIVVDGPYIDLNPATPEKRMRIFVAEKISQAIEFAIDIGAEEIIFLSTFLPMIRLDAYDKSWVNNSISFWQEMADAYPKMRLSVGNTFEYTPYNLLALAEGVRRMNFGLALDLGHVLAYSKIKMDRWFTQMEPWLETVFLHSNHRRGDEHLELFDGDLLKDDGFQRVRPLLKSKRIVLKLFDRTDMLKNIRFLRWSHC